MRIRFTHRFTSLIATGLCIPILLLLSTPVLAQGQLPPGFSKSFAPSTVGPGSSSRLTFAINNTDASEPATGLAFTDMLPAGMVIATAPNIVDGCNGTVTAPAGGSTITFSDGSVAAGTSCQIEINVDSPTAAATYTNISGDLTSSAGNSGTATADLNVVANRPGFAKSFSDSTVDINDTTTLTFLIDNTANAGLESGLSFSDTLPDGLVIASPVNLSNSCNGFVTANPGEDFIQLVSGNVPAQDSCSITVDVFAQSPGLKQNLSSDLASSAGNSGFATAALQVDFEVLTKVFIDNPVIPGDTTTLEFTITNTDRSDTLTGLTFTDDLDAALSGLSAVGPTPLVPCGAGSSLSGSSVLNFSGGNLAPGASCTFEVELQVPAGAVPGSYTNVTSQLTGSLGGAPFVADATDNDLVVSFGPELTKTFLTDPVGAGATTTLEFTIQNTDPDNAISDLEFEDDLAEFLSGVEVSPFSQQGVCGQGSNFFNSDSGLGPVFTLSGGSLAAGDSCTFSIDITVPIGTPSGTRTNTTSVITGTINDQPVQGSAASDDLTVAGGPSLSKAFSETMVVPGQVLDLEFTLTTEPGALGDTTGISFTDDLGAAMPGLESISPAQTDICGSGSSLSGSSVLTFSGGVLPPDSSCTFSVTVQVPADPAPGQYDNLTSQVSSTEGGIQTTSLAAEDSLMVAAAEFSKSFTDDPVVSGGTVTLEFTISNIDDSESLSNLFFTDDLDSTLSGLQATGLPQNDICGSGSSISGTDTLQFSGGNLAPSASCTFSVTLLVPGNADAGIYGNTTSSLSGSVSDGQPAVLAQPATDDLEVIDALTLQKSFVDDPARPGGTVTLQFTVGNISGQPVTDISFTDDLDAVLSGLTATNTPLSNVCGVGSALTGTSLLTLSGGTLSANSQCTFEVELLVPSGAAAGSYSNTTSGVTGLSTGETAVSGPAASDDLVVSNAAFDKFFDGPAGAGGPVQLTFTLSNEDPDMALSGLAFTDDLDAVVSGLAATGTPLSDVCGPGSSLSGTSQLQFTGGALGAGESCMFTVTLNVPAEAAPGSYDNTTSDLTSNGLFVADPATATLMIEPAPAFSKAFAPVAIPVGGVSTLTFTIDNSAAVIAASSLDFTDNLPAGLVVADPASASTTCTGGNLSAVPGSGLVSYSGGTVAAGSACQIQVDVTSATDGDYQNVSGDLTSSLGNSGPATASLSVVDGEIVLGKSFTSSPVLPNGQVEISFTLVNGSAEDPVTDISFSDDLDAVISGMQAVGLPDSDVCGPGSTLSGSSTLTLSDGSLAAGGSCAFSVLVQVPTTAATGTYTNTTSDVTGIQATVTVDGPAASADITIAFLEFDKLFGADSVDAGGQVDLRFAIANPDPQNSAMDIEFSDDLEAILPGLTAVGLPQSDVCGAGSGLSGTDTIMLTGGSLAGGETCAFTVTLQVPSDAPDGVISNVTSPITAAIYGARVGGSPAVTAVDDITVFAVEPFVPVPQNVPASDRWALLVLLGLMLLITVNARRRRLI